MSSDILVLNYPEQHLGNDYYTAHVAPGIGVCVAFFISRTMVQFFPWVDCVGGEQNGHAAYAQFVTGRAASVLATKGELLNRWPYLDTAGQSDILMIKCMIEEGIKQVEDYRNAHD